jgi:hypothetical protein
MDKAIRVELWSGAVGRAILKKNLEVATLNETDQHKLRELVTAFRATPIPKGSSQPGRNQRKFVFESGDQRTSETVRVSDENLTPPLRELFDFVDSRGS